MSWALVMILPWKPRRGLPLPPQELESIILLWGGGQFVWLSGTWRREIRPSGGFQCVEHMLNIRDET